MATRPVEIDGVTEFDTGVSPRYTRYALVVLFLAYLLNFYDRTVTSVLNEKIRAEFDLSDFQLSLVLSGFTVIYALAGIPLGRIADRVSRVRVLGWGVTAWSAMTALNGAASSFGLFLAARCGVGIGEASCAPAANSLIADYFPANRRAWASSVLLLGIPLGLTLAAFTVGPLAQATGSWRIPFFVAALPGLVVAVLLFRLREPRRGGAAPPAATPHRRSTGSIREVLAIPTMRWLIAASIAFQFALTAIMGFLTSLLQRYFGIGLANASLTYGIVVGLTGVVGLPVGGLLADRARRRSEQSRLLFGAVSVGLSAPFALTALLVGRGGAVMFAVALSVSMLFSYSMFSSVFASIHDVVAPHLRATAVAVYFAGMYVLGGAFGPMAVGKMSDALARAEADGGPVTAAMKAQGLHDSLLWTVPLMLLLTGLCMALGSRRIGADARAMRHG